MAEVYLVCSVIDYTDIKSKLFMLPAKLQIYDFIKGL